jgi:glucokinase
VTAIGFDIGGSFIKAGRLDPAGGIAQEWRWPTPKTPEEALALLAGHLREHGGGAPAGVACAGLVDHAGILRRSPNLPGWIDLPLGSRLSGAAGVRVAVLNDANAFLLAEVRDGAARGARSAVGLAIGTGVGGAIWIGGALWTGRSGFAGEIGHMIVDAAGPLCACGACGCLESLVGTSAIVERYLRFAPAGEARTPAEIHALAAAGDSAAISAFAETGRVLGLGLVSLTHLLDPEVIVIGGGISAAAELFLPEARRALAASFVPADRRPAIHPAALGNAAGWMGAALAAMVPDGAP